MKDWNEWFLWWWKENCCRCIYHEKEMCKKRKKLFKAYMMGLNYKVDKRDVDKCKDFKEMLYAKERAS